MSQRLLVVAVVLLAALATAFYFALGTGGAAEPAALGAPGGEEALDAADLVAAPEKLAEPDGEGPRSSRDAVAADPATAAPPRALDVRIERPLGAPADADLAVVAVDGRSVGVLDPAVLLLRSRYAEAGEEERGSAAVARAAVGPDGRARLTLPEGIVKPNLLLDGRFLYLREPRAVAPDETAVRLEPRLGACLVVRVTAPDGEEPEGELTLTGGNFGGMARDGWRAREAPLDADELWFGGLDPEHLWVLSAEAGRHFAWPQMGLELERGRETVVDLELLRGAAVAGVVVDDSGAPAAGAEVASGGGSPFGGNRRETETDEEGAFELVALAPGAVRVTAELGGWRPARSDELEVADGERRDGLRLTLERGASVAGRVAWPDGAPAAGAAVAVDAVSTEGGFAGFPGAVRPREAGSATCDDEGRFEVTGLPEGELTVRASLARGEADDAPTWRARVEDVPAGARDVLLTLQGPIPFSGRVLDDAGAPVRTFRIEADSAEPQGPTERESFTDLEGRFTFARVGAGTYTLEVEADGHVQTEEPEIVLPGADELELVLLRAARVAGRVLDPAGNPVADARVQVDAADAANPWARQMGPSTETDRSGAFELTDLEPGAFALVATADGWADSVPLGLELAPGEELVGAVLTLRVGGRIEGVVSTPEGRPEVGRRVTWGENAMGFGGRGETRTDAAGRFAFRAVTPGEWVVTAAPNLMEMGQRMRGRQDQGAWIELMGQMLSETVTVADGELTEVYLGGEPLRPVRVFGAVTRAGDPVPGARIIAVTEGKAVFQGMKSAESAADGSYELVVDRPGAYAFSVQSDRTGVEELVDVPRADEARVDLAIPLGGVEGRVRLASGEPAAGMNVSVQREDGLGRVRWNGATARTDGDGRYRIESLEEGLYTVRVHATSLTGASEHDAGAAVRGGVSVSADAMTAGVDFRLEEAGSVAGVVTGEDGAPVTDMSVFFRDGAGRLVSNVSGTSTGPSGRFAQEGLAPGDYTVSVRGAGYAANDVETVRVRSGETSDVRLSVETGVMVLVQLEDPEGQARRLRVEVFDGDDREVGGLITMQQLRNLFNQGLSSFEQRVGPLPPGRYTVRATTPEGDVVERRVTLRDRDEEKVVRLRLD